MGLFTLYAFFFMDLVPSARLNFLTLYIQKSGMAVTAEQVLQALSHVEEPDLKKDLVTLKMIEDIQIEGQKISFSVILTTPACPLKDLIHNACTNAIHHFISKEAIVNIKMTSKVTSHKSEGGLPGIKNIIAVASGKGGVGKSTVAVNLAIALSLKGAKVGLIDADIYGPSIPLMFDLEYAKPQARQVDGKTKVVPLEKYGIKLLSIGFFAEPGQAIPWRGPMVSSALKQLFLDADWGDLDYLIVDTPPGTGDVHITLGQQFPVNGAVIVTTPQNVALADTQKGMAMFNMNTMKIPLLGIIENMSYFTPEELPENKYYIFGKGGGIKLAQQFDVPFLGEIPIVQSIGQSGESGHPIVLIEEHPIAKAFIGLAEKVAQQIAIKNAASAEPVIS